MLELSKRLDKFVESPIRRIADLLAAARGDPSIISFGGGEPSLDPPAELLDFLEEELRLDPHHASTYTTTQGLAQLRVLVSADLERDGVRVEADNIILTVGSTEAIYIACRALINPGDEVLLFNPTYVSYEPCVLMNDGRVKWLPVKWQQNFQPDLEDVKAAVTKKTKAIVLLSPDNPTGRILSKAFVKGVADLAEDKKIYIISDEAYKDMVYEGRNYSPSMFTDNAIACCSFSKETSVPGFRVGYAYSNRDEVIKAMIKVKQFVSLCSVTPALLMLTKFYEHKIKERYLKEVVLPTYKRRRDVMVAALKKHLPEARFAKPAGAFYIFPDLTPYLKDKKMDDGRFSDELFSKKKVVVVPGHFFGPYGKGHVRLTFVSETEERIEEGVKRIADFVA